MYLLFYDCYTLTTITTYFTYFILYIRPGRLVRTCLICTNLVLVHRTCFCTVGVFGFFHRRVGSQLGMTRAVRKFTGKEEWWPGPSTAYQEQQKKLHCHVKGWCPPPSLPSRASLLVHTKYPSSGWRWDPGDTVCCSRR